MGSEPDEPRPFAQRTTCPRPRRSAHGRGHRRRGRRGCCAGGCGGNPARRTACRPARAGTRRSRGHRPPGGDSEGAGLRWRSCKDRGARRRRRDLGARHRRSFGGSRLSDEGALRDAARRVGGHPPRCAGALSAGGAVARRTGGPCVMGGDRAGCRRVVPARARGRAHRLRRSRRGGDRRSACAARGIGCGKGPGVPPR